MGTAISTWGNSEAARIPRKTLRLADLSKVDRVVFEISRRGRIELVPEELSHRRVMPAKGVTFDELFKYYDGGVADNAATWPDDDILGAKLDAWR